MDDLKRIKNILSQIDIKEIKFKQHFFERIQKRPINQGMVVKAIKGKALLRAEKQIARNDEEKYKLWFKLSNKYELIIIAIISRKVLYIVTGWNKQRTWQK